MNRTTFRSAMRVLLISTCLLLLLRGGSLHAKEYPILHFTKEQGLPSNTVYDIHRDDKGYLWFATDKGVSRYNGQKFENFTMNDGLADNEIYYFVQDYYGRMWLATYNGKLCYYQQGTFHNPGNTSLLRLPFLVERTGYHTLEKDSSVTVCYGANKYFLNITRDRCHVYAIPEAYQGSGGMLLRHIAKVTDNLYEFIYEDKIVYMDTLCRPKAITYWPDRYVRYHNFKGQEFFITKNIVYNRQRKIGQLPMELYRTNYGGFYRLYYEDSVLWVGSNMGFFLDGKKQFLENERVSCIRKDIDSNYWIATLDNGVFLLKQDFRSAEISPVPGRSPIGYAERKGTNLFYFGADQDMFRMDLRTHQTTRIFAYSEFLRQPYVHTNSAYVIDHDTAYILSMFNMVKLRNISKGPLSATGSALKCFYVKSISYEKDTFWTQFNTEVRYIRKAEIKQDDTVYSRCVKYDFSRGSTVLGITRNRHHELFFTNTEGVFRIAGDSAIPFLSLHNAWFRKILFVGNNLLGLTNENQLIVYPDYRDVSRSVVIANDNSIWDQLYELDSLSVLVTTNNLHRVIRLGEHGAMPQCSVLENPFVPLSADHIYCDGTQCYFFKAGMLTIIPNKDLIRHAGSLRLFFLFLQCGKKQYRLPSVVSLDYAQSRVLNIYFDAISFSLKNIQFEYAVFPQDESSVSVAWNALGTSRTINLYNLSYGSYKVLIRAKTASGQYSAIQSLHFTIGKPYWATWWFRILVVLLVALSIAVLVSWRFRVVVQRQRRTHQTEMQLMKSEYKALNALMNPHFIFNTLNSVQRLINIQEKEASHRYMKILSRLIRQNMQNVSKELIPLNKEIELVENYLALEKLRFKDKLSYLLTLSDDVDAEEVMIPPLLIQPLVENAVKHGILPSEKESNLITLSVDRTGDTIVIRIEDDGVGLQQSGRHREEGHESFGMANIEKRLAQLSSIYGILITFKIEERIDHEGKVAGTRSVIVIYEQHTSNDHL